MSQDPVLHVIWDASAIAPALTPKVSDDPEVSERASSLLSSVVDCNWRGLCFHIPRFCLAETKCILDKQFFCTWNGVVKRDPTRRLSKNEHQKSMDRLDVLTRSRAVQLIDQPPDANDLMRLIAVLNYKYRYRRRSNKQKPDLKPMGAADVLLATIAIDLATKVGSNNVVVVTCDRRLSDVLKMGRTLNQKKAKELGLVSIAKELLGGWSNSIYPPSLNLRTAKVEELARVFGDWPLPSRSIRQSSTDELSSEKELALYALGKLVKAKDRVGPDSLPYSPALRKIQVMFARDHALHVTQGDIAKRLLGWRKNPKTAPKQDLEKR